MFTPRLPPNLAAICAGNERAARLARELLRALGGALTAIGVTAFALVFASAHPTRLTLALVLLLILPAEGVNAFAMRRVGSPYYIPLAFIALTLLGAALASAH